MRVSLNIRGVFAAAHGRWRSVW